MDKNTLEYALRVLDTQAKNTFDTHTAEQRAYYAGLKVMLDIVVSNGYKTGVHVEYCGNGCHYIIHE